MPVVKVIRYQRRKDLHDSQSPLNYYLKRQTGMTKTYNIKSIAKEIEVVGALSAEDVEHVIHALVRVMRKILIAGNSVKIERFGSFFTTFRTQGAEKAEDCTVKNIKRVNVRFRVDPNLRLVNDSNSLTRGAENNVVFKLVIPEEGKKKEDEPQEAPDPLDL